MVKTKCFLEVGIKNNTCVSDCMRDFNAVTKLPALREAIRMFDLWKKNSSVNYLSLAVYEIPQFLHVLENYGIDAVNEVISVVSEKIRQIWGDFSYIAHIMEDRFAVFTVYDEVDNVHDIYELLKSEHAMLDKALDRYFSEYNKQYYFDVDYGYVVSEPERKYLFEDYLRLANSEMLINHLKKDFKISNNSRTVLWKHQEVFNLLIDRNLFHYHFQPIVDSQSGKIYGYEALMRTDPIINMRPLEVLDIATNLGKLYEIEKATMYNVLQVVSENDSLFENKKIFINSIPSHTLNEEDLEILVDKYGYVMNKVVLEMTEQTEINDEQFTEFRNYLEKQNISLAIDDYGTGFSNLSNLLRYKPSFVKIDRSLVKDIQEKKKIQKLVSGIIDFIHENGYFALAEGVETYEELKVMIGLGADYIQGYYIAMPEAELLKEIDGKLQDEIVTLSRSFAESIVKVYCPKENEVVNLAELSKQHYSSIIIDKTNVVLEGEKQSKLRYNITVKDGVKTNITLRNVSITTEKENSLIDIGDGSCVTLNVEGTNELVNRGIRVPQGAELVLTGEGSINIHTEMSNSYAIGEDKDCSYGNITIDHLMNLNIDAHGENCIGIGGGKNSANSMIRIVKSGIQIECAGGNTVGIGSFEGNSNIEIRHCDIMLKMSCASAAGIGALSGKTEIILDNYRIRITESGNNLCGVGVLVHGTGSISASDGSIEIDGRGRSIICMGTDYGILDCNIQKSNSIFYCEGSSVVGIGDMNGRGCVNVGDAVLNMTIMAQDVLAVGSKNGQVEVVDSRRKIKINE